VVPGFAVDGVELGDLVAASGRNFNKGQVAVLGEDQEHVVEQEDLSVFVVARFPFDSAGLQIEAGQDSFVEAVDVTVLFGAVQRVVTAQPLASFLRSNSMLPVP